MFFCPNCNNAYDISKDSIKMQHGGVDFDKLITTILDSEIESIIKDHIEGIDVEKFLKSPEYKKLNSKDKELVFNRIQDVIPVNKKLLIKTQTADDGESNLAYFVCKNCIYNVKIKDGTRIYSKTSEDIRSGYRVENMDMKIHSNILPMTRKYICPNDKCSSHKDIVQREAIIFRSTNSFVTTYICKACKIYWSVSN